MNVIIHCSASKFGTSIIINDWHNKRGWRGIGYHAVILNGWLTKKCYNRFFDGKIESGRAFDDDDFINPWEYGAHTKNNNKYIGVCLIGESGKFTSLQLRSLSIFIDAMQKQFGTIRISQHSDFDREKKDCAGLTIEQIQTLISRV